MSSTSEVTSLRLDVETEKLLNFLSNKMHIPKSTLIKIAVKQFIENALKDEIPKDVEIYILQYHARKQLREIKTMRWVNHQLMRIEEQLKLINEAKNGNSSKLFKMMNISLLESKELDLRETFLRLKKLMEMME
jgi:predicted DNA-binding protein